MDADGTILGTLAERATKFSPPHNIADAEAILKHLAGPFLDLENPTAEADVPQLAVREQQRPSRESARQSIAAVHPFNAAYDAIPDGLLVIDRQGTVALVNRELEKLFGYAREELLGEPVEILVPDRLQESHPLNRQKFFDRPHVRPMGAGLTLHGRHRDGHEFPVEISLSPLQTEVGTMAVATIRDMSEQKRIETQIRRFETRYRTLVEGLPAVSFMAALDEGVNELYVSPQIETLLGFSQQEWLGNPILWYTQLHPDDRNRWHTEFAITCSTGQTFSSIYRFYSRWRDCLGSWRSESHSR